MNLKSLISSKELKHSVWAVVLLTLIFGFNDGSENFILSTWIYNLFSVFFLVAITVLVNIIGAKIAASRLDQNAELRIVGAKGLRFNILGFNIEENVDWNVFGFRIKYIPFGAFIGLLTMLISFGLFYFTAVFTIVINKAPRLGKGYYLDESKEALIYFWALASNIVLILIFNSLNIPFGVTIGTYFVVWNLLPIPGLLGSKIFFNNKTLYLFFLAFTMLFLLFATKINFIILILSSAIIAFFIMLWWFFKKEYHP